MKTKWKEVNREEERWDVRNVVRGKKRNKKEEEDEMKGRLNRARKMGRKERKDKNCQEAVYWDEDEMNGRRE